MKQTKESPNSRSLKRGFFRKKSVVFGLLGALLFIVAAGATLVTRNIHPTTVDAFSAKGPLVFQKSIRETSHVDPEPGSPTHPYEPVQFQLYNDGTVVCANVSDQTHSHEAADAPEMYGMTTLKLSRAEFTTFINGLKSAKFIQQPSVVSSNDYSRFSEASQRQVYSYVDKNGNAKNVVWVEEKGAQKSTAIKSVDTIIDATCHKTDKHAYQPAVVKLSVKKINPASYKSAELLESASKLNIADIQSKNSAVAKQVADTVASDTPYAAFVRNYTDGDRDYILKTLLDKKQQVIVEDGDVRLVVGFEPSTPQDIGEQIEALGYQEMNSVGIKQAAMIQDKSLGMKSSVDKTIAGLDEFVFPKVAAVTNNSRHIEVRYVELSDYSNSNHALIESKMGSLAGAVANWYKHELPGQNFTYNSYITKLSMSREQLAGCTGMSGGSLSNCLGGVAAPGDNLKSTNIARRLDAVFPVDPNIIRIYVIDQAAFRTEVGYCGAAASAPAYTSFIQLNLSGSGECQELTAKSGGRRSYELGAWGAHEMGHMLGLTHTYPVSPARPDGLPANMVSQDIMNYDTIANETFPGDIDGNPTDWKIHLSPVQKEFILGQAYPASGRISYAGSTAGGIVTPPTTPAPKPPTKDPRRGENDGKWTLWPNDWHYWNNPALPGRCVVKDSNGNYMVGQPGGDYDCNALAQQRKCQDEFAKLDPSKPATFANANISPECGNQSNIRAAGSLVQAFQLSQTVPKGSLDGRSNDCVTQGGWAYSEANRNIPINVDLYYDGPAGVGTGYRVQANVQRDDLKPFGNNGIHGFSFNIPEQYKDTKAHTVYMYAIGIQTNGWPNNRNPLIGQATFSCDYPPQGNVEKVDSKMEGNTFACKVYGWAYDRSAQDTQLQVHAYIDGVPGNAAGSVVGTAGTFRADLKNAGQGNGKHSFSLDIPPQFRDANKHTVKIYALGVYPFGVPNEQHPLIGEKEFQCDQPPEGNLEIAVRRTKPDDPKTVECVIGGWAADRSQTFYDNKVALYFDLSPDAKSFSSKVYSYPTGIDRPDVRAYGIGWGNHGFLYSVPKQYWDGKDHKVNAYSLNIDINGVYIAQNNTFIGTKTFNCGK